jgi:hypothetical protein
MEADREMADAAQLGMRQQPSSPGDHGALADLEEALQLAAAYFGGDAAAVQQLDEQSEGDSAAGSPRGVIGDADATRPAVEAGVDSTDAWQDEQVLQLASVKPPPTVAEGNPAIPSPPPSEAGPDEQAESSVEEQQGVATEPEPSKQAAAVTVSGLAEDMEGLGLEEVDVEPDAAIGPGGPVQPGP